VSTIANIVVGLIALLHVYIMVLEMFLWDKPAGLRAFGQSQKAATGGDRFGALAAVMSVWLRDDLYPSLQWTAIGSR
jgi:putative membrane protein